MPYKNSLYLSMCLVHWLEGKESESEKGDGKIREKTQIVIVCYSEKGGEYWWVRLFFTWAHQK